MTFSDFPVTPEQIDQSLDALVSWGLAESRVMNGELQHRITARGSAVMAVADVVGYPSDDEDGLHYIMRVYDAVVAALLRDAS
jgi:hypothetical protein